MGTQSSIQLAVERLTHIVEPANIFVGTNRAYADILRTQLPALPESNYILEPSRRDVAAAVALAFFTLEKDGVRGPVIFQWSDHYVSQADTLLKLFAAGKQLVETGAAGLVIIAQQPGFANDNLGWINVGDQLGTANAGPDAVPYFGFGEWAYRPSRERCQEMFQLGAVGLEHRPLRDLGGVHDRTVPIARARAGEADRGDRLVPGHAPGAREAGRAVPAAGIEQLRRRHPEADPAGQGVPAAGRAGLGRPRQPERPQGRAAGRPRRDRHPGQRRPAGHEGLRSSTTAPKAPSP